MNEKIIIIPKLIRRYKNITHNIQLIKLYTKKFSLIVYFSKFNEYLGRKFFFRFLKIKLETPNIQYKINLHFQKFHINIKD